MGNLLSECLLSCFQELRRKPIPQQSEEEEVEKPAPGRVVKGNLAEHAYARKRAEQLLASSKHSLASTVENLQNTEMALAMAVRDRDEAQQKLVAALSSLSKESKVRDQVEAELREAKKSLAEGRGQLAVDPVFYVRREEFSAQVTAAQQPPSCISSSCMFGNGRGDEPGGGRGTE